MSNVCPVELQNIRDARAYSDSINAQERIDLFRAGMERDYLNAALSGNLDAKVEWAPLVNDYDHKTIGGKYQLKRNQTVSEVLLDSFYECPAEVDMLAILIAAANGEDVIGRANDLLRAMARKWVDMNDDIAIRACDPGSFE